MTGLEPTTERSYQTHFHNIHFKMTGLVRRFLLRRNMIQQDTLLYNPKECREGKKLCPFFLLENSRPLSPWGPLDFLSTCLGNDSLIPPFSFRRIVLLREKGRRYHSITAFELRRGFAPKLARQHILLIFILRISDPGAPNSSWRCYAPSLYLRTDRESKSTTGMQKQEGSLSLAR